MESFLNLQACKGLKFLNSYLTRNEVKTDIDLEFCPPPISYVIMYHVAADGPIILKIIKKETSLYDFWHFRGRIYTIITHFLYKKLFYKKLGLRF